ncbi:HAD-IA family hydrolase [Streptomyces sp. TRM S81-3]|uniref:HAD-IA family hydrolase n=1 Tax=Streptomyces griseicoloratus TaxID=2752516 RepID=A0A926QWC0_9ACTN|nr:HAD-IA family hydrolase [Streptomyces griseicoloratus]MBD0425002.1 HAD-IA family hydrolase [Streptomyces griseicoloratus]
MGDVLGEEEALSRLLGTARAVLFDFDGPVTDLFRGVSTAPVADEIKEAVRRHWGALDPDVEDCDDSHGVLLRVRDMLDRPASPPRDRAALDLAEAIVTRHEYEIVRTASPTPHLGALVEALLGLGMRLVIVSNNADGPVCEFLKSFDLQSKFEAVMGRDPKELRHMKPSPESVNRAVEHLALAPDECVLIGDQLTDLSAARAAGTRFIGCTRSPERAAEMMRRGADRVVSSLAPLVNAAKSHAPESPADPN